jgi:hypothetical protein
VNILAATFDFAWHAPVNPQRAYVWRDKVLALADEGPCLALTDDALTLPFADETLWRTYYPLRDETGLFRMLAEVERQPEPILNFANRYGRLGRGVEETRDEQLLRRGRLVTSPTVVETLDGWRGAISWLQYVVRLWDRVRENDHQALTEMIRWDRQFICQGAPDFGPPQDPDNVWVMERRAVRSRDFGTAAALYYHRLVDTALRGILVPTLGWNWHTKQSHLGFSVQSLWGAILLQFATAIAEDKHYQQCPGCGRWFELSPGVNRAGRVTCSDACRQRAFRQRRERALELYAEGKTPRDIAQAVESDVQTVKRWIKAQQGRTSQ